MKKNTKEEHREKLNKTEYLGTHKNPKEPSDGLSNEVLHQNFLEGVSEIF